MARERGALSRPLFSGVLMLDGSAWDLSSCWKSCLQAISLDVWVDAPALPKSQHQSVPKVTENMSRSTESSRPGFSLLICSWPLRCALGCCCFQCPICCWSSIASEVYPRWPWSSQNQKMTTTTKKTTKQPTNWPTDEPTATTTTTAATTMITYRMIANEYA